MTELIIRYAEPSAVMDSSVIPSEVVGTLVRCKDCRHGWYDDDIEYYTCRHPKGLNEELYGVDFCSYGERAEQTDYKLPGHDEVMEALDKMTLRGDKDE